MLKKIGLFLLSLILVLTLMPINILNQAAEAASAYYVAFDGNGATSGSMSKQTIYIGVSQPLSNNQFKKTNYVFSGWNTKKDGSGTKFSNGASVKNLTSAGNTVTLYAQWTASSSSGGSGGQTGNITVTYNGNGATSGSMSAQTLAGGAGKLNKNRFAKTNASFLGWSTDKSASKPKYMDGEYVTLTSSTTLYAVWSGVNNVTVTFHPNGASGNSYTQTMSANTLTYLDANLFSRSGYSFQGWSNKADGSVIYSDRQRVSFSSNVKLYAIWKKGGVGNVTITFNGNGATSGSNSTQTLQNGEGKLGKNKFVRTGYTFAGWSTVKTATQATYADGEYVKFSKNTTLYAVWKSSGSGPVSPQTGDITITFNSNNGSGSQSKQVLKNGSGQLAKCKFTRKGYVFEGWALISTAKKIDYKNNQSVNITKNVTLYAIWRKQHKITFNKNSGTGKMLAIKCLSGNSIKLTANKFKKKGYDFAGWATSKSGTVKYKNKQKIKPSKDLVLYAVWKAKKWTYTSGNYVKKGSNVWNIYGTAKKKMGTYKNLQCLTCDGTYLYGVFKKSGTQYGKVAKFDLGSKSIVKVSSKLYLGHANDVAYNPNDGCLYITRNQSWDKSLTKVRASSLKKVGTVMTKIPSGLSGASNASSCVHAYNGIAFRDGSLYVRAREGGSIILKLNSKFKATKGYVFVVKNSKYPYHQGMAFDGNTLCVAASQDYTSHSCAIAKGKLSGRTTAKFHNLHDSGELEGVFSYGGHMYVGVKKGNGKIYLRKF